MSGRPLRFLAGIVTGWTALRVLMLWPAAAPEAIRTIVAPDAVAADAPPRIATLQRAMSSAIPHLRSSPAFTASPPAITPDPALVRRLPDPDRIALAMVGLMSFGPTRYLDGGPPQLSSPLPGARPRPRPSGSRWSASMWLLLRDGQSPSAGLGGGQLGGGQGGLRIAYALGQSRRVALVGRLVGPISGRGREAALGIEWRPTRLPVRLVAEQRFSLDGGRGGPVVGLVGGTGLGRVALGFDLETYGQAGVIRRGRTEPFADGAARVTRRIASIGKTKVDLGLGTWGGAQRDARRLDIGPTLGVRLPVGGKAIRLAIDWRQRIAGEARPNSGPALTIGSDF